MIVIKVKTGGGCNATFTSAAPATATQYVLSPARPLLPPHPSVAEFLTAYTLYVHKVGRTMALSSSVRTKVPCSRKCGAFSIVTPEDGAEGKPSLHFFSLAPMESSACAGKCSWCIDDRMIGWCSWCMCKEQVRLFFLTLSGFRFALTCESVSASAVGDMKTNARWLFWWRATTLSWARHRPMAITILMPLSIDLTCRWPQHAAVSSGGLFSPKLRVCRKCHSLSVNCRKCELGMARGCAYPMLILPASLGCDRRLVVANRHGSCNMQTNVCDAPVGDSPRISNPEGQANITRGCSAPCPLPNSRAHACMHPCLSTHDVSVLRVSDRSVLWRMLI